MVIGSYTHFVILIIDLQITPNNLFIYSNCILHPYGSSNNNTKACKYIQEKQHKHNLYANIGEIFDRRGPYRPKSSDCFMKVQTTEVGLSM